MTSVLFGFLLLLGAQPAPLPTLVLPADDGAWVVRIVTTGGFTGQGAGNFTASSTGELLCVSAAACPPRLVPEARRSLTRLVRAAIEPSEGRPRGPFSGTCNDCVTTTITLRLRERDGERMYTYSWDQSTSSAVPEGVLRLHAAVVALAESRSQ